jgi:hypothetical protein
MCRKVELRCRIFAVDYPPPKQSEEDRQLEDMQAAGDEWRQLLHVPSPPRSPLPSPLLPPGEGGATALRLRGLGGGSWRTPADQLIRPLEPSGYGVIG